MVLKLKVSLCSLELSRKKEASGGEKTNEDGRASVRMKKKGKGRKEEERKVQTSIRKKKKV